MFEERAHPQLPPRRWRALLGIGRGVRVGVALGRARRVNRHSNSMAGRLARRAVIPMSYEHKSIAVPPHTMVGG